MKVQTNQLKPGMILLKNVLGKSGKPLMEKRTELTGKHIEFLDKFMISDVQIVPLPGELHKESTVKQENNFEDYYERIVKYYKKIYAQIQNKVPLQNFFEIRKILIPFFETVQEQPFTNLLQLLDKRPKADILYGKSIAMSMLATYLAKEAGYEKKDWLQIGFAAMLADIGFARMSEETQLERNSEKPSESFQMHPFHSYKVVKEITTLTKQAKVSILQHQERLDGTGYPAKITDSKITTYARIIAICDYFLLITDQNLSQTIHLLDAKKGVKLDRQMTEILIEKLTDVQKEH